MLSLSHALCSGGGVQLCTDLAEELQRPESVCILIFKCFLGFSPDSTEPRARFIDQILLHFFSGDLNQEHK